MKAIHWSESRSLYRALFLLVILLFHLDSPLTLATKFVAVAPAAVADDVAFVVAEVLVVVEVLAVKALVVSVACCSTLD